MIATTTAVRTEEVAQQLCELGARIILASQPGRRRIGDLKELEYHTLAILSDRGTMIVGDIQRLLGVLPAQMSRIIRSLEAPERELIVCRINPRDKRKVDVSITPLGLKALADYRAARVHRVASRLRDLSEEDQEAVQRALEKLLGTLDGRCRP